MVATAASRRVAIEHLALEELDRLTPPAKVASSYRAVIAYSRLALRRVSTLEAYARSNEAAGARSAKAALKRGRVRLVIAALRAGVQDCSSIA
ncbi:MAG: hypothetical protein ACHQHO_13740 [Solirubrobacterales bacterium]